MSASSSPMIQNASWGKVRVEGYGKEFKDVKLFPGGAREWDWNETGTSHDPGIQEEDLKELLENGARYVILSQGYWKRLNVPAKTQKSLEERGVGVSVLPTGKAVEAYNEKASSRELPVGALIHSTC
ncbi:MAG: Mth938-like domain-containing protein [Flavobacteriales bacterium]